MVNEEIVGGIKNALERGDSLRNAMMSFFNAGYDRKEIEEAAATLLHYPTAVKTETKAPTPEIKKVEPKVEHKIEPIPIPKVIQKVSSYGEEKPKEIIKPKKKGFLFFKPKAPKEQKEMPKPIPKVIVREEPKFIPKELPKTIINAMPQTTPKKIERTQKVSSSSAMTPQEKAIIAILVGLLIFLVGLLITIFLFRQQLIDFISSMVG